MMQRQITHPAGTFAACATCTKEPHHYTAHGSARHEGPSFSAMGERHQLECVCDRRTGWCGTLAEAARLWDELGETLPPAAAADISGNVHPIRAHRAADATSPLGEKRANGAERGDSHGNDA